MTGTARTTSLGAVWIRLSCAWVLSTTVTWAQPAPAPDAEPAPAEPAPAAPAPGPPAPIAPAAPPAPPPPPPPYGYAPPPAVPPAREPAQVDPTRHLHDGFYFRLGLGAGALGAHAESDGPEPDADISGGGAVFTLMIGGTPTPGLTVGGMLLALTVLEPIVEVDGVEQDSEDWTATSSVLGIFVDGFFDPTGGLHAGGGLGLATFDYGPEDSDRDPANGFGAAAWIGYDTWIASQWSLGAMLVLSAHTTERDLPNSDAQQSARTGSFGLLVTGLLH